jgi:ADP-ribose pyrophosphatase YjhB (NUDIX family)
MQVVTARNPDSDGDHPCFGHEVLAAVLQVREGGLHVLLWRRALPPHAGRWALPGGALGPAEDLGPSVRRQLAEKVDVRELSHLEQLESRGAPRRVPPPRVLATTYLGLIPGHADPALPADTRWHPAGDLPRLAFDHAEVVAAAARRLRSKLSYTNLGFALAPPTFTISELRELYTAALGHEVSATNLQRVLVRRELLEDTSERRTPGPHGGRPATVFRFRSRELAITDQFAVLRPPAG